jgi:aldehyde dehydrogenase (NAD+)
MAVFANSGQICSAGTRLFVESKVYDEFVGRVAEFGKKLNVGNGLDPNTQIGPLVSKQQLDRVSSYLDIGRKEGAKALAGGAPLTDGALSKGYFVPPTVFANVQDNMRIAQEEIFGPTTALIPVESFEEAVAAANSVQYGLSSSIFTRDVNKAFKAMRDLQTGITYINAGTTGAEVHLPFGGMKQTGNGHREAGQAALDVFTEWKSVYVDYSGKLQRAQIDNQEHPAPR